MEQVPLFNFFHRQFSPIFLINYLYCPQRFSLDLCPKFTAENDNEILVPTGIGNYIKVNIQVNQFISQRRFNCKFIADGETIMKNARLMGDTIYCNTVKFESKSPQTKIQLNILWDKKNLVENPNNIHRKFDWFNLFAFLNSRQIYIYCYSRIEFMHERLIFQAIAYFMRSKILDNFLI